MSIEGQKVNIDFNFKLIFTLFFSYFLYLQLQNVALEEMAAMLIFEYSWDSKCVYPIPNSRY